MNKNYINKILDSIEGCLSISVGSCDKCVCKKVPSPRCKNKLLMESAKVINFLKEGSQIMNLLEEKANEN